MGLLDVLNGMQKGPRGQTDPNAKGGMSPTTMAILALLAHKGVKHVAGKIQQAPAPGAPAPSRIPQGRTIDDDTQAPGGGRGGLGNILGGLLGGGPQAPGEQPRMPGGRTLNANAAAPGGLGDILGGLLSGGKGARAARLRAEISAAVREADLVVCSVARWQAVRRAAS